MQIYKKFLTSIFVIAALFVATPALCADAPDANSSTSKTDKTQNVNNNNISVKIAETTPKPEIKKPEIDANKAIQNAQNTTTENTATPNEKEKNKSTPPDDDAANKQKTESESDETSESDDNKSTTDNTPRLSEADSKAKVDALRDNAQKMKDKEKSFENRMLGAAAIGATGIGGMNLMSGMAEESADADAEESMRAYLATFVCDYGAGQNIRGGQTNIEVPGGNDLISIVTEYRALAADLKARKTALGKQPGIESEVIFDAAETGLYDNVGAARQSGAYASLSRALMDENSEDAQRWNEQKADARDKKNTGLTTAIAGVGIGIAGNLLLNSKNKNKSDEIINEYEKKKQVIRQALKPLEDASRKQAQVTPDPVEPGKVPAPQQDPAPAPQADSEQPQQPAVIQPQQEEQQAQTKPIVTLYNKSLFDSGKYELKTDAKTTLNDVIKTLKDNIGADTSFKIVLAAHTDRDKVNQTSSLCKTNKVCDNTQLAQKRGDSVKDYLTQNSDKLFTDTNITVMAIGEKCAKATKKEEKATERKVDFYILFGDEQLKADHDYCNTATTGGGTK